MIEISISIVALVVAAVSLMRTRAFNQQQLDLQRVVSDLARKQLEILNREEVESGRTHLDIQIVPCGNAHEFLVSNVGAYPARDIEFEVEPQGGGDSPLIQSDYNAKFPVPVLQPSGSVGAMAAFSMGSARGFKVTLRWKDASDSPVEVETFLAL